MKPERLYLFDILITLVVIVFLIAIPHLHEQEQLCRLIEVLGPDE